MEIPTLKAERRSSVGTKHSRRLREGGRLPGIIYGHGETPEAFSVSAHDVWLHLKHGARIVKVEMDGTTSQLLIKSVDYDHLNKDPIHIDLARVDPNERVRVQVAIELKGVPKGVAHGGLLEQFIDSIEVECLALEIPDTFHPSVADLDLDESITVGDLNLPDGVTVFRDADQRLAMVRVPAAKAAEDEGDEGETEESGTAEPERIGRVAAEEESDEKKK